MVFHLYKPLVCPLLPLVRIARDCRPGINVLAWDDMMREATVEQVRNLRKVRFKEWSRCDSECLTPFCTRWSGVTGSSLPWNPLFLRAMLRQEQCVAQMLA